MSSSSLPRALAALGAAVAIGAVSASPATAQPDGEHQFFAAIRGDFDDHELLHIGSALRRHDTDGTIAASDGTVACAVGEEMRRVLIHTLSRTAGIDIATVRDTRLDPTNASAVGERLMALSDAVRGRTAHDADGRLENQRLANAIGGAAGLAMRCVGPSLELEDDPQYGGDLGQAMAADVAEVVFNLFELGLLDPDEARDVVIRMYRNASRAALRTTRRR